MFSLYLQMIHVTYWKQHDKLYTKGEKIEGHGEHLNYNLVLDALDHTEYMFPFHLTQEDNL